jgi:hypothetical protein
MFGVDGVAGVALEDSHWRELFAVLAPHTSSVVAAPRTLELLRSVMSFVTF